MPAVQLDGQLTREARARCWSSFGRRGYALATDEELGLGPEFRAHMRADYYSRLELEHLGVPPLDRHRACSVLLGVMPLGRMKVLLRDAASVAVKTPEGTRGAHRHGVVREYKQLFAEGDPLLLRLVACALDMTPPTFDLPTMGDVRLDYFRTFGKDAAGKHPGKVVSGKHQDGSLLAASYCVAKTATGGETTIGPADDLNTVWFRVTLEPGMLLVWDDQRVWHDVAPMDGGYRDAMILSVPFPRPWRPSYCNT